MNDFPLIVFASGRGSNLAAIFAAIDQGKLSARVAAVFSDRREARALEIAKQRGVDACWLYPGDFRDKAEYEYALMERVRSYQPKCVVLAGFMRILSAWFLEHAEFPIVNIHPSLLPAFPGLNPHEQVLDSGVRFSGCTVHFVDEATDMGPIIMQRIVPVLQNDTAETLADRVLKEEHILYSTVLEWLARGLIKREGRKVIVPEESVI